MSGALVGETGPGYAQRCMSHRTPDASAGRNERAPSVWRPMHLARLLAFSPMLLGALGACAAPAPIAASPGVRVPLPTATTAADARPSVAPPESPGAPARTVEGASASAADDPLPPARPGPCPAPTNAVRALYTRAVALASQSAAPEPPRAIAEAIRVRLGELYQSGCRPSLDDPGLFSEITRLTEGLESPPKLFVQSLGPRTVMVIHHGPQASTVAMYAFHAGQMRTRVFVTDEGPEMERTLLLLDAALFQPSGAPEPLLVVANTHPWMASCWRNLRFRVLAGSATPDAPTALLDHAGGGRWCEGITIQTEGDDVRFLYDDWAGPLRFGEVQRPRALSYHWDGQALERRFGFAGAYQHLVEDWLAEAWPLASQATVPTAAPRLAAIHDELAARVARIDAVASQPDSPTFSFELFPAGDPSRRRVVVYCARIESEKACTDWPKPVEFVLEREGQRWFVADAKPRP